MRHMSCDQIAPFIAFHSALQSDSAVYSCLPDSSEASEKSASSGVRSESSGFKAWSWFSSRVTIYLLWLLSCMKDLTIVASLNL